jgi:hypothetical protein
MANAMLSTVNPKARETPTKAIPKFRVVLPEVSRNLAASTALPHPPNTSQQVPRISAMSRLARGMFSFLEVVPQLRRGR